MTEKDLQIKFRAAIKKAAVKKILGCLLVAPALAMIGCLIYAVPEVFIISGTGIGFAFITGYGLTLLTDKS